MAVMFEHVWILKAVEVLTGWLAVKPLEIFSIYSTAVGKTRFPSQDSGRSVIMGAIFYLVFRRIIWMFSGESGVLPVIAFMALGVAYVGHAKVSTRHLNTIKKHLKLPCLLCSKADLLALEMTY